MVLTFFIILMPELIRLTNPSPLPYSLPPFILPSVVPLSTHPAFPPSSAEDGPHSRAVFQLRSNLFREGHYN